MEINTVVTGVLDENCYILKKDKSCLIVDPGDDYLKIKEAIGDCKVAGILITHAHFDHVGALRNFLKRHTKIFKRSNTEEKEYTVGDFKFSVIYTPGHAKDLITFYFEEEKVMFDGDFIFKGTIGRCDLPGGDEQAMRESLEKIIKYDENIVLYPGHGEKTSIKEEKENNQFIKEI